MRNLPTLDANVQIQPVAPPNDNPAIEELNQFGQDIANEGKGILQNNVQMQNFMLGQQGAVDLETKANELRVDAAAKFSNPAQQQAYFTNAYQAYSNAYVQNLPPESREYALKIANKAYQGAQNHYTDQIIGQQVTTNKLNFDMHLEQIKNNIYQALAQNNPQLAAQGYQKYISALNVGTANNLVDNPSQVANDVQNLQNGYNGALFTQQVLNTSDVEARNQLIANAAKNGIGGMDPHQLQSTIATAKYLSDSMLQGQGVDKLTVENNFKIAQADALDRGVIDTKFVNDYAAFHPDEAAGAWQMINRSQSIYNTANMIANKNLADQAGALQDVYKNNDALYYNAIQTKVAQLNAQFKNDAFTAVANNPAVVAAQAKMQQTGNAAIQLGKNPSPQLTADADPIGASLAVQQLRGANPNDLMVMPKSQAVGEAANINAMPVPQRMQELDNFLAKNFPGQFQKYVPIALQNLKDNGVAGADLIAYSAIKSNPQDSADILQAISMDPKSLQTDFEKVSGGANSDVTQSVSQQLAPYFASIKNYNNLEGNPKDDPISDMQNMGETLTKYYMGVKNMSLDNASKLAANVVINDRYQSFPTVFGSQIRVPNTYNGQPVTVSGLDLNQSAAKLIQSATQDPSKLVVPLYFQSLNLPKNEQQIQFARSLGYASTVQTNRDDSGITLVTQHGDPVLTTDNKPFSMDWNTIAQTGNQYKASLSLNTALRTKPNLNKSLSEVVNGQ